MSRTRTRSQQTPNPNHSKRSKEGISLLDVISNGNLKELKRLVKSDKEKVNVTGEFILKNGRQFKNITPIFAAILSDQYDMVKFLLQFPPHIELKKEKMKEDADFDIEIHRFLSINWSSLSVRRRY